MVGHLSLDVKAHNQNIDSISSSKSPCTFQMYASSRYLSLLSPDLKTTHLDLFSRHRRNENFFRTRGMAEISEGYRGGGRIRIIGQSGEEAQGRKGDVVLRPFARIVTDIGRNFTQTTITSRHHIRSHFNVTHEAILRKETGLPNLSPSAACSVCRNGGRPCTVAHLSKIGSLAQPVTS
jgi:hypothetical protein